MGDDVSVKQAGASAKKKVAIVGCSPSKSEAPFNDPSFEIWGVNNLYPHIPRATRWFEIHEITATSDGTRLRRGETHFRGQPVGQYLAQMGEWAQKQNCPVYMQQAWPEVPTVVAYPIAAVLQRFGGYFTNSISWMLALALLEGFDVVHVYGVDMAVDSEYHHQRPSCEYFLGLAVGLGVDVYVPPSADLLKARFLYGFQEPQKRAWDYKLGTMYKSINEKRARISHEINELRGQIQFRENQLQQYAGAEVALKESNKIWS